MELYWEERRRERRVVTICCLLFLCLFCCTGCQKAEEIEKENREETMGQAKKEEISCLVLYDGGAMAGEVAERICEKLGAKRYDITKAKKEEMTAVLKEAEYLFLGSEQEGQVFYEHLKTYLPEACLEQKKVALFFLNPEEERENWENKIKNSYPEAVFLPSLFLDFQKHEKLEEFGRLDGWMTTALTYELIKSWKKME